MDNDAPKLIQTYRQQNLGKSLAIDLVEVYALLDINQQFPSNITGMYGLTLLNLSSSKSI